MLDIVFQLILFSMKAIISVALILILFAGILALLGRGKDKTKGHISIKNLNQKYKDTNKTLLEQILPKKQFKQFLKQFKTNEKAKQKDHEEHPQKNLFVLNFKGDIKASAVEALREEITAIIGIAKSGDEVVLRLESPGGLAHAYGLSAAQLLRLREHKIPLTVTVDKVAASGGYMMACVADKILSAPFAIIGSIGVIVQMPNFHRLLKEKNIDFEQLTAGNFKRTLTVFGANTEEGREKLQQEIEEVHDHFKQLIQNNRPQLDINKVATGEHWLGEQAFELKLVDEIKTSDDFLLNKNKDMAIFEITYNVKKSLGEKLFGAASRLMYYF